MKPIEKEMWAVCTEQGQVVISSLAATRTEAKKKYLNYNLSVFTAEQYKAQWDVYKKIGYTIRKVKVTIEEA